MCKPAGSKGKDRYGEIYQENIPKTDNSKPFTRYYKAPDILKSGDPMQIYLVL